jgi:hypothetical protein
MTDEEKLIIKKELYKAYLVLESIPLSKRYVGAIILGLNNAQRQINENRKE